MICRQRARCAIAREAKPVAADPTWPQQDPAELPVEALLRPAQRALLDVLGKDRQVVVGILSRVSGPAVALPLTKQGDGAHVVTRASIARHRQRANSRL